VCVSFWTSPSPAMVLQTLSMAVAVTALVMRPCVRPSLSTPRTKICAQGNFANDGEEVDWDKEASKLARPHNRFFKALSDIESPELIKNFAQTAPKEVQFAVKATVSSLLGNLPPAVAESAITTTGRNLATLMFNMQMTGYMFRNAAYRSSLLKSLDDATAGDSPQLTLPPISGEVEVSIAEGMVAKVDAKAYMAELRSEVEGLRSQLAKAKEKKAEGDETALIQYIQGLDRQDQAELTQGVSSDVLEAMSQLVATILIDLNIEREMEMAAPAGKLRELLITQLVTGYTLRELEVRDELKDSYWGIDASGTD